MEIITAQLLTWLSEIYRVVIPISASLCQYTSAPEILTPSEAGVNSTFSTMHARIGSSIMAISP